MAAGDYNPVNKRIVYVGGLSEEVDQKVVQGAFLPFGDIVDISIPLDYETEKHRGFCFVEFENAEDAAAAIGRLTVKNEHYRDVYSSMIFDYFSPPPRL